MCSPTFDGSMAAGIRYPPPDCWLGVVFTRHRTNIHRYSYVLNYKILKDFIALVRWVFEFLQTENPQAQQT
jgi:hypothetical protein